MRGATPSCAARADAFVIVSITISRSSWGIDLELSLAESQYHRPVSIQKASKPIAHTSVGGPTAPCDSVCSGAIQRGVPRVLVAEVCDVARILAMPKSSTFTVTGALTP